MSIELPPALFYFLGALLIVFGGLRAWHLGWRRRDRAVADEGAAGARELRRHLTFGIIWVVMGLFLVISTFINVRR